MANIKKKEIGIDTVIRLEQLYGVSHKTLVLRLKELHIINSEYTEKLMNLSITKEAALRGFDDRLYKKGEGERLIIGDFGSKARKLFDEEKISEGHYMELLNVIGYGKSENSSGC